MLRRFSSIEDAENELQRIAASIRPLLTTSSVVRTRGAGGGKPSAARKVGTSRKSQLHKNITELETLRAKAKVLDNLIANVNSQFRGDEDANVKRIISAATKLRASIEKQLKSEMSTSTERTQEHISPEADRLAKQIKSYYARKLEVESSIEYADGMLNGDHIMTAYVVLHNVHNFAKEVTPQLVIAVSQYKGEYYINPGLTRILPPGQFNKGFPVTTRNEAVRYVDAQLEADSNISTISPKPVPIEEHHFSTSQKVKSIKFGEHSIRVTLPLTIKSAPKAQEVANDLFRDLAHAVKSVNPKNRDRIVYAMKKSKGGFVVEFKFASGSANAGRTVTREEVKTLQEIFTPTEISKIRKALSE